VESRVDVDVKHIIVGDAKIIILWMNAETPSQGGDRLCVTLIQVFTHQFVVSKGFVSTFGVAAGRYGRKNRLFGPEINVLRARNIYLQILSLANKVRTSFC
jgi:hypothetical protein